jgi:hypothetical protein
MTRCTTHGGKIGATGMAICSAIESDMFAPGT